eukprot:TRINITY_DN4279_c1_g4_i1.p1 TRINITY_DN4279_c1_g4~~TRINITY_DN4279_c1_g4_i1.p1  ORF type:complete len:100 (+),score=12.20 TRINITY_DN4279_c1_g4_i1:63-362(+)
MTHVYPRYGADGKPSQQQDYVHPTGQLLNYYYPGRSQMACGGQQQQRPAPQFIPQGQHCTQVCKVKMWEAPPPMQVCITCNTCVSQCGVQAVPLQGFGH